MHAALNSDWNRSPDISKHRQIIVVMSDAAAHPLDHPQRKIDPGYPSDYQPPIPTSLSKLQDEWLGMFDDKTERGRGLSNGGRLLLFTPNDAPWSKIAQWNVSTIESITAGKGISEEVYEKILLFIAKSV